MLAAIFTDLHCHNYKQFNEDGSRLKNCLAVIDTIYGFCKKNNIKYILFAGDLYDTQKVLHTEVVNEVIRCFTYWSKECPDIEFIAISGNHDHASKNTIAKAAITALDHLQVTIPTFRLIDNSSYTIGDPEVDDEYVIISGIPYYEFPDEFKERLYSTAEVVNKNKATAKILLQHQTPSDMGNESIPVDIDIKDPVYKAWDYIYNGHIHTQAQLTSNFLNVGTPIHRDLADEGHNKGFIVTDIAYPNDGYKFISLKGKFPEFKRKVEGDQLEDGEDKDFVVWSPPPIESLGEGIDINIDDFKTDLSPAQLVENFWREVNGSDKELLQVGIKLVS